MNTAYNGNITIIMVIFQFWSKMAKTNKFSHRDNAIGDIKLRGFQFHYVMAKLRILSPHV